MWCAEEISIVVLRFNAAVVLVIAWWMKVKERVTLRSLRVGSVVSFLERLCSHQNHQKMFDNFCAPLWPRVLWSCSAEGCGVVSTCAEGQRFGPSSRLCSLSYSVLYVCETETLKTTWMPLVMCLQRIIQYHLNDLVSNW